MPIGRQDILGGWDTPPVIVADVVISMLALVVVKLFFFVVVVVTLAVVVLSGGTIVDIIIDMVELVVDVMELVELIELGDVDELVDELVVKVVVGGWDESGFSTQCPDLYVVLYNTHIPYSSSTSEYTIKEKALPMAQQRFEFLY